MLVYPAPNGAAHLFGFDWNSGFARIWWLDESNHQAMTTELINICRKYEMKLTEINNQKIIICTAL